MYSNMFRALGLPFRGPRVARDMSTKALNQDRHQHRQRQERNSNSDRNEKRGTYGWTQMLTQAAGVSLGVVGGLILLNPIHMVQCQPGDNDEKSQSNKTPGLSLPRVNVVEFKPSSPISNSKSISPDSAWQSLGPYGGQLTLGAAAGFASGYAMKKVGKVAVVVVGGVFIGLQSLSYLGYIKVNWTKVEDKFNEQLDVNSDGRVDAKDAQVVWDKLVGVLKYGMVPSAGFAAGLALGLKTG